jgi:hypothetical protein
LDAEPLLQSIWLVPSASTSSMRHFIDIWTSCYAITALRVLLADWLDDYEHPTIIGPSTGEVAAVTLVQSVTSSPCTPHSPTFRAAAVMHHLGLSLPLLHTSCHYFHGEPLCFGCCGGSGGLCLWLVRQRCAIKLASRGRLLLMGPENS